MLETRKGRGGRSTTPFEINDWQLGDMQKHINAESFTGVVANKEDGEERWELRRCGRQQRVVFARDRRLQQKAARGSGNYLKFIRGPFQFEKQ